MFKGLMKMKTEHQLLFTIACIVILIAIFWPRENPFITASVSAHINNVGGKIKLEAFDESSTGEEFYNYDGKTMALFYAPWCGHCKRFMPEWKRFKKMNNTDIKVVAINCDENTELAKRFGVQSFPTIYFLPYGLNNPKARVAYEGERKGEALLAFIADK